MRFVIALLVPTVCVLSPVSGQDKTPSDSPQPKYETRKDHDPNGTGKFYMGREIALVMGHLGAGWLERPEREREEAPAKLVKAMRIKPGMVIGDIGAGSGYFTFRIAPLVGDKGKVYAVDIQKEMLAIIKQRMKSKNVDNVIPVRGKIDDPKLPAGKVDLIFMVDCYHEFSHPYEMTRGMIKALKPGGELVFVEYRKEDPKVPINLVHKMFQKQVLKEMAVHPEMRYARTIDILPWQHIIIFEKKSN